MMFSYRAIHAERIPSEGGCLLAMNHQSFLDPPLAGIACRRPVHFLARRSLLKWPLLGPIFPKINVVPVDRGGADMSALKTVIRLVKEGGCTVIFPEGTRTKDGQLQPAQAGLGLVIAKSLVPVVPMRIFGSYEAFPRDAKLPRRKPITVVVGEPMIFTEADIEGGGREVFQRLSDRVMERIAAIKLEE
ncbi:MAG: lysophospholipid acyltransferase family protein [Chthoniobacteraceae bacterium]